MKVKRPLLIHQYAILKQIKSICDATKIEDCCKCPYEKTLCKRCPESWDLKALISIIEERSIEESKK